MVCIPLRRLNSSSLLDCDKLRWSRVDRLVSEGVGDLWIVLLSRCVLRVGDFEVRRNRVDAHVRNGEGDLLLDRLVSLVFEGDLPTCWV